jgi:CheY-like chemotaxis protein
MALKTDLNARQQDIMNKIRSTSNILLGVINDILDISKIEAGKMEIENRPFNLRDLIENLEGIFSEKANKKGISLVISYEDISNFNFSGDERRLSQILINLLNNAIKFTHRGVVNLRIKALKKDLIHFEVQDTGIGLKEQEIKLLFQEFMQADMSTSRHYGGTGLGLAISKRLVEMMGGRISVSSDFGVGSTFSLELPLTFMEIEGSRTNTQEKDESLEHKINALKGIKILVAEDNKMNQMLLEMLLEESSVYLDFAKDGQIALKKFKENDYDLILMDIQMPYMNGYEATEEIRRIDADIPIIALSANVMQEDIDKALAAGMNDWLAKPIEVEKLYAVLLQYIKEPSV